jgi:pimeloyl-ACP methyl ester carboxylesterase
VIQLLKMQSKVIGEGKPIVLVPGGLTGWVSWEPHEKQLLVSRKVVRVQLLNVEYGFEDRPLPQDYSVKTESRALAVALDDLSLKSPVDLAAWSYGALITLDFALDYPERVRTLALIEPPAIWVLRARGLLDSETRETMTTFETLRGDISEEKLEQFLCSVGFCPPGQSPRTLPQWPHWMQYRQALRNSPALLAQEDDLARIQTFEKPVLLVKGTGSAKFLHQIVDVLAELLPNAQVAEMPGGHSPQIASMDQFLERLAVFQGETESKVA